MKVIIEKLAIAGIDRAPTYIAVKLKSWVELVEQDGILVARKIPGYHDEPLKGQRKGQRSIRLNRHYRALYAVERSGGADWVVIKEVNKHAY